MFRMYAARNSVSFQCHAFGATLTDGHIVASSRILIRESVEQSCVPWHLANYLWLKLLHSLGAILLPV
jgi:hypothetical protein